MKKHSQSTKNNAQTSLHTCAPLSLDQTAELIIIDCHEDKKRFSECALNNTAPDLTVFLNEVVILPQLERRKALNLALF